MVDSLEHFKAKILRDYEKQFIREQDWLQYKIERNAVVTPIAKKVTVTSQ